MLRTFGIIVPILLLAGHGMSRLRAVGTVDLNRTALASGESFVAWVAARRDSVVVVDPHDLVSCNPEIVDLIEQRRLVRDGPLLVLSRVPTEAEATELRLSRISFDGVLRERMGSSAQRAARSGRGVQLVRATVERDGRGAVRLAGVGLGEKRNRLD